MGISIIILCLGQIVDRVACRVFSTTDFVSNDGGQVGNPLAELTQRGQYLPRALVAPVNSKSIENKR